MFTTIIKLFWGTFSEWEKFQDEEARFIKYFFIL